MTAIKPEDWGRIYAFIWWRVRNNDAYFKNLFETDPNQAVKEMAPLILTKAGVDINYYDSLFNIDDPPPGDFNNAQLEAIREDTNPNPYKFFFRLTC